MLGTTISESSTNRPQLGSRVGNNWELGYWNPRAIGNSSIVSTIRWNLRYGWVEDRNTDRGEFWVCFSPFSLLIRFKSGCRVTSITKGVGGRNRGLQTSNNLQFQLEHSQTPAFVVLISPNLACLSTGASLVLILEPNGWLLQGGN